VGEVPGERRDDDPQPVVVDPLRDALRAEDRSRVAAALHRDAREHEDQVEPGGAERRVRPVHEPAVLGVEDDVVRAQVPVHQGVTGRGVRPGLLERDQVVEALQHPRAELTAGGSRPVQVVGRLLRERPPPGERAGERVRDRPEGVGLHRHAAGQPVERRQDPHEVVRAPGQHG
jgi:hypothetical protein